MLKTYLNINELQRSINAVKKRGGSIGFVPTMGALHDGHVSLIKESMRQCDFTICSIFVNPTQFNDPNDYKKYPRDIEKDQKVLEGTGCDCLFLPSVEEIYPSEALIHISFEPGPLEQVLEGAHRPGHFAGMASVVKRLLDIVSPNKAFFGQKDYQQYLIVKEMAKHYAMPIEIVKCPIVREKNGLAMSSRNQRLSPADRETASLIYKTLMQAVIEIKEGMLDFETIVSHAMFDLKAKGNFDVDYFDICSADTLEHMVGKAGNKPLAILTAVWIGGVRLIDNILV